MRIGLITDVHNHAAELTRAIALFQDHGVDQIVTIGDTCDAFGRGDGADEVTTLLHQHSVVGVWGNHDFTLCRDVTPRTRERYPERVFDVMARMQPRLVLDDCHFSHKEASIDPHDVAQLWELSDQPLDLIARAGQAFSANTHRWQFVGHYHRWWAATPSVPVAWSGQEPLTFDPAQRYFVVVAAVCEGGCGILDTSQGVLNPLSCAVE